MRAYPEREYIPQREVAETAFTNDEMLAARYQDELHVLRAKIIGKIASTSKHDPTKGLWQFYLDSCLVDGEWTRYDVTLIYQSIKIKNAKQQAQYIPYIHLIESTWYETPYGTEYYTRDVTVDEANDSQHIVSSFGAIKDRSKLPSTPTYERKPDYNPTVPLCTLSKEGALQIYGNFDEYVAPHYVSSSTVSKSQVCPFGDLSNISDTEYSLGVAKDIYKKIADLKPFAQGPL